jgi:hypothetical protein
MTPYDDIRWRDGVNAAVAALQAGETHSVEDRETLRREIRAAEQRLARDIAAARVEAKEDIAGVAAECREFRASVTQHWDEDDRKRVERAKVAQESRKDDVVSKRTVTAAWIGGGAVLASSILSTLVVLLGGH